MSLLEQNITRKKQVDKKIPELNTSNKNNKEYKVNAILESAVNAEKSKSVQLPDPYYLIV